MITDFWINIPVKSIERSKKFFNELGFTFRQLPDNREDTACLVIGSRNVQVMLFEEPLFKTFSDFDITDTSKSTEVLFSIDASNTEEVDNLALKVKNAGGKVFAEPNEKDGWLYGFGFADPDGHRWSVLYMEISKMPKHQQNTELQVP